MTILLHGRLHLVDLHVDWRRMCSPCLGLVAAAAGGVVASRVGLPAPWLTGGICAAAIAALVQPLSNPPKWLTNAAMMALGISVGSRVNTETLEHALSWPASLGAMAATVAAMFVGSYYVLRFLFRWDGPSAFWASSPGAVGIALSMAAQTRANIAKVAIVQLVRVFAVMILLPVGLGQSSLAQAFQPVSAPWLTVLLFVVCYAISLTAEQLRVPAGMLIGGIVGATLCLSSGLFAGASPNTLVTPACIIISASVGARFSGLRLKEIAGVLAPSIASLLIAASIGLASSVIVTYVTGLPLRQVLIAYAPGGLDALIAASILLGADSLYVAAHQVTRFVLLSLCLPIMAQIHERRLQSAAEESSVRQKEPSR